MRITYREGEALILAEADEISAKESTLTVRLRSGRTLMFPFVSREVLEDFFRTVIVPCGDNPIPLENTSFDPRLGELLDDWDSMYE